MTRKQVYAKLMTNIEELNKISFAAAGRLNPLELSEDERRNLVDATQRLKVVTAMMEAAGIWE